ncbi:hypothetical protein BKA58DRAFT_400454 [Alternaria rosae]|uniref:uncharacterized protein n=1 Tax=Alternaria rosae TaxID=1187941 RepID=UPI001E8E52A6|nr:uncharacterized protein BKA58DRAFT_400454 [Alternaria rosae]KAH6872190.1 hypothetical protein BKA58DRAFT_400454 [Alternaria rosae]
MNGPPNPQEQLDYYEILRVNERASRATIERCYKRLQHAYHPDSRRVGATPSTEHFQSIGVAWDTLKNTGQRRRYDRDHARIRREWDIYRIRMGAWESKQREKARRQAKPLERERKIAEEEVTLEKERLRVSEEKAAEAARRHSERVKAEEARRQEQAQQDEEVRRREEALRVHERERLQEERRRQRLARAEEEKRIKADWERAQRERGLAKDHCASRGTADEDGALRTLWREKQERTHEQAKRAEAAYKEAAQERLRKQQEELPRPNEDDKQKRLKSAFVANNTTLNRSSGQLTVMSRRAAER